MIPDEIKAYFNKNGLFILIVGSCVIVALLSLLWLPKNNPLEEAAEKEILLLTGIPIDFTPDGPTSPPPPEMPKGMNGPAGPI